MRSPRILTTLFGIFAIAVLSNCSRESSVKEDVSLKNNHSRVFAQREAFDDPKAFADSVANTAFNAADSLADTLTVTVNDTVYLMGILPRNVDKIYRFQWNLTKKDGKDTVIIGNNATPRTWAYAKPGVYYPLFIAFDGNNSTDTAGTDTKRTYIKVIDSKPNLTVPKDTLWTSSKGDITFPILASDSFGVIKHVLVDLDASGKDTAQVWKYETRENNDSLYLTIKNKSKKVDSLGNQKIYVIVEDDDGNQTKDSVNLHFNKVPKLKVLYPLDGARHNISERFYFYYEGTDSDNPQDLKYFIYAQVSKNGQPPVKAFDNSDLIAEEYASTIFEPMNADGKNVITLINDPSKELTGRIYWDMYVTDGYDIVHMERVSTGENSSRPWSFYIGDLKSTQGSISGVAQYQGRTDHSGISVELTNGIKTFTAVTDAKGYYTIKVDAGSYTAIASSSINEYKPDTLKDLYLESGVVLTADSLKLKDTIPPMVMVKNLDTLKARNFNQTIYARDLGSRLASLAVTLNGKELSPSCTDTDQGAIRNCIVNLDKLEDGVQHLVYTAVDNAGLKNVLKQDFVVDATTMTLNVNGGQKSLIGTAEGDKLDFTANIINALPAADSVTWSWTIAGTPHTKKTAANEDGIATFQMVFDDLAGAEEGKDYLMTATYSNGSTKLSAQVKFGKLGNDPAIIFTEPGLDTKVSMNDPISFKTTAFAGQTSSELTVSWDCGKDLSDGVSCPEEAKSNENQLNTNATLAFSTVGVHKVTVTVKDDKGFESSDVVEVEVIKDPPSIKASTSERSNEYKINATVAVTLNANDKFGTINKISWGCSNGKIIAYDYDSTFATPKATLSDFKVDIRLPGEPSSGYKCLFKATDDDGEFSYDSLTFVALLDPPTVKLAVKQDTVKIKSSQTIKANATDKLGYIAEYDIACSESLASLKNPDWSVMPGASTSVMMPNEATNYYCVVQVLDDDGNAARDTVSYVVLVGRPTVTAVLSSAYETVTVRDTIELNAIARDSLGTLVKYEWGCGSATSENIGFNIISTTTPRANVAMPTSPEDKYLCIIRVTDDDGNTAYDTAQTKVILAPPTIKVTNDTLTVREGFNMALNATASDNNNVSSDPGAIIKREWSCGVPTEIEKNWKNVSSFDTVWKAPAPQVSYYCIARAMDNDSNFVSDTTIIKFSTQQPIIQVKDEIIYINVGDKFSLSATVNDVWQGIDWFTWECIDKSSKESFEKDGKAPKYDYKANGGNMTIGKDSSYSERGKDMYCIVSAQETSTKATFKDTTEVRIMEQHPLGVISAADTVYLWSGDENVDEEAIYFYTKEWGGMKSQMGELGKKGMEDFYWNFTNVNGGVGYYRGNPDGTLDTGTAQFNTAFVRKIYEGSITISLDYRDSTTTTPSIGFYSRHRAEEVKRKVYFRKAWENLAKDTVIESTGKQNTAPALAFINDNPVEAYPADKVTAKAMVYKKGAWSQVGTASVADSITSIKLASDGSDLYMGVLNSNGDFSVYKSTGGTSAFAKMGSSIAKVSSPQLLCPPAGGAPVVVYINTSEKLNYLATFSSSAWASSAVARVTIDKKNLKFREIDAAYLSNGNLAIVAVDTTSKYNAYSSVYVSSTAKYSTPAVIDSNINKITLATSGSKVYLGFSNRDVEKYGPYIYAGSASNSGISWTKSAPYDKPIFEGYIAYHMSIAVNDGVVYVALDDNGKADYAQIHVFKLADGKWHFYGENELPYFGTKFHEKNKYYLRGSNPQLAIDGAGKVHLSMLARENAHGTSTTNNGPLVMKYVADNWEIHE